MRHLEENFVLEVCRAYALRNPIPEIDTSHIDLSQTFGVAARQKVLPIVASSLLSSDPMKRVFKDGLDGMAYDFIRLNEMRHTIFLDEGRRLAALFSQAEIPFISRKGATYCDSFYPGPLRSYNDIDFFIAREYSARVKECLAGRGYADGYYSRKSSSIVQMARAKQLTYMAFPTHFPPMVRLIESPIQPAIKLDIAFEMTWPRSEAAQAADRILSESWLKEAEQSSPAWFHFIDASLHLFREAFFEDPDAPGKAAGVNLRKFVDVSLIWAACRDNDVAELQACCGDRALAEVIAWVGYHTDELFGLCINQALGLHDRIPKKQLHGWTRLGGRFEELSFPMRDRLFMI